MSRIPAHIIDEIITTARIEEVIGDYVHLKKAGSNFKGLSPFTEERTPSFMVSPAKQIFKCFSTGKGGTVVTFVMEIEQFSYPEALRWLADRYNITIPESKPLTAAEQEELTERESLQIVNTYAKDYFVDTMMNTNEGRNIGLSYFKERGFRIDIIEKFQLGYCPREEKSFTETAIEKGYKQKYLEQLGLTKTHGDRRFDFFSGRVIFPIHSVSGKVLGFGGRILQTDKKIAKYFNSPESILYDKSRILYGMYYAKGEIIKQDNCFLVEGYTDVISFSQAGIENVVSSSGTSLTKGQIKLIQRYTQNITVLYDSDNAGIKASFRGIDLLLEEGMTVKVVLFPEGEDPDSFAKKIGSDELKKYLEEHQKDFVGFKTEVLFQGIENDPIKKAELIKEIISSVALIPDEITRSVYIKQIASQFDFEEHTLLNELNKIRRKKQNETRGLATPAYVQQEESSLVGLPSIKDDSDLKRSFHEQELDLIRVLTLYGDRAVELEVDTDGKTEKIEVSVGELIILELEKDHLTFSYPIFHEMYEIYKESIENGEFHSTADFLRHQNPEIIKFVTDILSPRHELSTFWIDSYKIETTGEIHRMDQLVKEVIYSFKTAKVMAHIQDIQEQLKGGEKTDPEEINEMLKNLILLDKVRVKLAEQLNRIVF
ncbi:MAG TPA: DNA primase [Brumimicrobium sp.]|nr:DNA primase [Brumimicrobium sp.]